MIGMSERILFDLFRTVLSKENEWHFTHVKFGQCGSKLRQENNKWRVMRIKKE
ncbi:MAG: hypothetical protein ACI8SR_002491 [Oceanicoccus sp.]|jgi:hypothetical protein